VLVDRLEDLTHPEIVRQDPKSDRNVALFGYVHGSALRQNAMMVHLAGKPNIS
jgi:ribosome biogenesis protein BMS1